MMLSNLRPDRGRLFRRAAMLRCSLHRRQETWLRGTRPSTSRWPGTDSTLLRRRKRPWRRSVPELSRAPIFSPLLLVILSEWYNLHSCNTTSFPLASISLPSKALHFLLFCRLIRSREILNLLQLRMQLFWLLGCWKSWVGRRSSVPCAQGAERQQDIKSHWCNGATADCQSYNQPAERSFRLQRLLPAWNGHSLRYTCEPSGCWILLSCLRSRKKWAAKKLDTASCAGGHTIGFVHCDQFLNRIYNFSSTSQTDPTMSATFAQQLRLSCSPNVSNSDPNVVVFLDQTTSNRFDNAYYKNTVQGEGVLTTDQELFTDFRTRSQVVEYTKSNSLFVSDYVNVITKLGSLKVLTGTQGEIRRALDCSVVNWGILLLIV